MVHTHMKTVQILVCSAGTMGQSVPVWMKKHKLTPEDREKKTKKKNKKQVQTLEHKILRRHAQCASFYVRVLIIV